MLFYVYDNKISFSEGICAKRAVQIGLFLLGHTVYRLGRMQSHVEQLLVAHSEFVSSSSSTADDPTMAAFANTCTQVMHSLCQGVWPCLALVGGVSTGYVRGG